MAVLVPGLLAANSPGYLIGKPLLAKSRHLRENPLQQNYATEERESVSSQETPHERQSGTAEGILSARQT